MDLWKIPVYFYLITSRQHTDYLVSCYQIGYKKLSELISGDFFIVDCELVTDPTNPFLFDFVLCKYSSSKICHT